jgi:hypothetical protein
VKNLTDALASIRAPIDDEDLVAVTLNGLGKYYIQFHTSIGSSRNISQFPRLNNTTYK